MREIAVPDLETDSKLVRRSPLESWSNPAPPGRDGKILVGYEIIPFFCVWVRKLRQQRRQRGPEVAGKTRLDERKVGFSAGRFDKYDARIGGVHLSCLYHASRRGREAGRRRRQGDTAATGGASFPSRS